MGQAVAHGFVFPVRGRVPGTAYTYSPGFLASLLLHVPLGLAYLRAVQEEGPIDRGDWAKSVAYLLAFAALGVAAPNRLLRDKHSPYAFTEAQLGPYHVTAHGQTPPESVPGMVEGEYVLRS